MSLINKMLQDLDARGGVGDDAADSRAVKAVPVAERERRPLVIAAVAGTALALLAAGGWYGWPRWQEWRRHGATAAPAPLVVVEAARPMPVPGPPDGIAPLVPVTPVASTAPTALVGGGTAQPQSQPQQGADMALEARTPVQAGQPQPAPPTSKAAQSQSTLADIHHGGAAPVGSSSGSRSLASGAGADTTVGSPAAAPSASAGASSAADRQAAPRPRRASADAEARAGEGRPAPSDGVSRREITPKVESDSAYRRALAALQDGRVSVAMADLQRAVEIDPRNESARQTYVSLLLENNRPDEAIRQLRLSLGVEPRQPALAMVLARLQLERGGPALATLMKTLPYAANNADYLAFLAGVLQREQRHADAARYYRDALQIAPNNGVWWMGLGISLQADQHAPEAREAYARARASAGMTAELLAFVDRKLELLAR
jgi:MSHA biogenesis protein MshN